MEPKQFITQWILAPSHHPWLWVAVGVCALLYIFTSQSASERLGRIMFTAIICVIVYAAALLFNFFL